MRGYRIELQEIEDVLAKAPGVRGAAVKLWRDASGENALVAYVEGSADVVALRQYLSRKIPEYMIPSRFIELEALPLTPNAKLNRKALPDPAQEQRAVAQRTDPGNDTERRVAALWADLLNIATPDLHHNFFHLGGHSLLAAELSRRIHAEFGKRIGLSAIFEAPTIAGLSALLDSADGVNHLSNVFDSEPSVEQTCLNWMYGGTFFHALASHLRPTYRLQDFWLPLELENTIHESDRLEDVARLIAIEMRKNPPNGPYHLGGWCVLGILAYEVGVQLQAMGEEIGTVVLLGAPNPQHYLSISGRKKLTSKLRYHWKKMTRLHLAQLFGYVTRNLRYHVSVNVPARTRDFNRILMKLALRYEPKPLRARVLLFQGEDRPGFADYAPGWTPLVNGEFAAYDVPGGHTSSLEEPNVAVLGAKLRNCLESDNTREQPAESCSAVINDEQ